MKLPELRVGYVGLHLGTYYAMEHDQFGRAIRSLAGYAEELGYALVVAPHPVEGRDEAGAACRFFADRDLDLLVIHAAACSLADPLLEFAQLGVPLALWGTPEPTLEGDVRLNSFVTLQILASTLRSYVGGAHAHGPGPQYKWFYGNAEDKSFADRLGVTIRALRAVKTLRQARIGLVGDLAPGFYNLSFDEASLRSMTGVEIQRHPIQEILAVADAADSRMVHETAAEMAAAARRVNVSDDAMERSARVYLALRKLADDHGYPALAVRDWPEFQDLYQLSPLLGMAWLTERDGIPVACEGDSLGAVCLIALAAISGGMPTLVDMGAVDEDAQSVLLWHLGSSPHSLADSSGVTYEVHSTLGRNGRGGPWGAVVDQVFKSGPVTIMSLSHGGADLLNMGARIDARPSRGLSGDRGWSSGHILDGQPVSLADLINTLLVSGLAHHCAFVPGDWTAEVAEFGAWLQLGTVHAVPSSRAMQPGPVYRRERQP